MSFKELQSFYREWHQHDMWATPSFIKQYVEGFFKTLPDHRFQIVEIGGGNGSLANLILPQYPFDQWYNIDLALPPSVCKDNRYYPFEIKQHLWDNFTQFSCRSFPKIIIGSHIIEHMTAKQLEGIIDGLSSDYHFVYFEVCLPEDTTTNDWHDYPAPHVLKIGWKQVTQLMEKYGFEAYYVPKKNRRTQGVGYRR